MTDEALRELERTARGAPDDAAAGHALARELARRGLARRYYLELSRVARLGDEPARETLAWWSGTCGQRARVRPVSGEPVVEARVPLDPEVHALAARTRSSLLLWSDERVYVLDARTLEEWVAIAVPELEEGGCAVAPCGDELLIGKGRTLALHGPRGERLARCELGGRITGIDVSGDRALVFSHRGNDEVQVFLLDVGEDFGRRLHTRVLRDETIPAFVGGAAFPYRRGETTVADTTTGEERATGLADVGWLVDAGRGRALTVFRGAVSERVVATGETLWRADPAGLVREVVVASESIALVVRGGFDEAAVLTAHERTLGTPLWSHRLEDASEVRVASGEVVTVVERRPHLRVHAFELATGASAARPVAVPAAAHDPMDSPAARGAALVPGGVVVLARERGEPRLLRIATEEEV